jgi:hypothetical protein
MESFRALAQVRQKKVAGLYLRGIYIGEMAPEAKTEQFLFKMGETEARMLNELSEKTGLTKADVLRQLIRREHAAVIGEAPPKKRPKK